jgi:hypothetical protein
LKVASAASQQFAIGNNALASSTLVTTGLLANMAVGAGALRSLTTGERNMAIGYYAMAYSTTAQRNLAIGRYALGLTNGDYNLAIGSVAAYCNGSGNQNVAVGVYSYYNSTTGDGNTAIGFAALSRWEVTNAYYFSGSSGNYNTAIGAYSLWDNQAGAGNTSLGYNAGYNISSGTNNVTIGYNSGNSGTNNLTTGSNNIILGYNAAATSASVSNQITLGNASVTNFRVPGVGFDIDTNRASVTGYLKVSNYSATTAPVVKTADFTLADTENYIVNNAGGNITVTLPSGSAYIGREVTIINWTNHSVDSSASNVYPHNGGSLGTAINAGIDGRFSTIVYDGTNWYIMATNA